VSRPNPFSPKIPSTLPTRERLPGAMNEFGG
jgi:hypothetical protein